MVVGGTGFYLRWFIWGKPDTPPSTPATEAAASTRLEQVGGRAGGRAGAGRGAGLPRGVAGGSRRARRDAGAALPGRRALRCRLQAAPHPARTLTRPPPVQAYAEAAAAAGRELSPAERWAAGCALVAALGDAASAARLAGEVNNQYRLLRVVDILLQTGGRPLAGARARSRGAGRAMGASAGVLQRPACRC